MLPIRGVYEIAIRVRDLGKSEAFYREILDFQVGIRDDARGLVFLRAGGQAGMLVLQEDKGTWPIQHFAFTVAAEDIEAAAELLVQRGVSIDGPIYHEWMPAKSVYFSDPDGHKLELCAPLSQ